MCRLAVSQCHHMRSISPGQSHHIAQVAKPGAIYQQTDIHRPGCAQALHLQAAAHLTQQAGCSAFGVSEVQLMLCTASRLH